ncbi:MAG TPA: carboxypeptidase regulatory-like domain-containing protein, partial [Candidatus Polarisedimenticolia bacterium]|nr:carboxypeptidase regulatory-like domain-containing protein [Candidatus Polarisedimenticolia bacterium]
MWNRRILLASLSAIVLFGTSAFAQETTTGTITGNVTDPTGRGIPGAVVIATSGTGTQVAESDAKGHYVLPFLRPGTYTLRVEAPGGFNTVVKSDVTVGLNVRVQMDFTLEPGKTETVTVTGETPLVDPKSTASSTNLKYEDFANSVPLGRSFTDTYAVAPGVVSGLGTGQGNYAISGASGLENSYLIDGVNVTNTGYGGIGAYNIVYGSLGTGVTSEFLDEVQIKTGGFEAEYGQALGGIINTIV